MTSHPVRCTLSPGELRRRGRQFEAMSSQLLDLRQQPRRAVLHFPADSEGLVREFVADESRCCAFLTFEVDAVGDSVSLSIGAPEAAEPLLAELLAVLGLTVHGEVISDRLEATHRRLSRLGQHA